MSSLATVQVLDLIYLVATVLFILAIKWLS